MKDILSAIHVVILMVLNQFSDKPDKEQSLLIQPYFSYASLDGMSVRVSGRVIKSFTDPRYKESSGLLAHMKQVVRLFLAAGEGGITVVARIGGESFQ